MNSTASHSSRARVKAYIRSKSGFLARPWATFSFMGSGGMVGQAPVHLEWVLTMREGRGRWLEAAFVAVELIDRGIK